MKYDKQIAAKKLRQDGKPITFIAKQLGVSKGSVSLWVQDIKLTEEQIKNFKRKKINNLQNYNSSNIKHNEALQVRQNYQIQGREKAKEKDLLHCMGCMLFWAEGAKKKNLVSFCNSDVNMLKLFVAFLKQKCDVLSTNITMYVNCFLTIKNDINNVEKYWIEQLDLHGCKIGKHTCKITNNPIHNYGICTITVCNTKLAQQLYGAIQEYGQFDNGLCINNKRTRTSSSN